MKRTYHEILSYIHENEEAGIREISSIMIRRKQDYRDFYGLVALLHGGYVGFTGPIHPEALTQARVFQCYSQGEGFQACGHVQLLASDNKDSYFYIGPKGIEYFHQRAEARRGWILTAVFSLVAAILTGIISAYLTESGEATKGTTAQTTYSNEAFLAQFVPIIRFETSASLGHKPV